MAGPYCVPEPITAQITSLVKVMSLAPPRVPGRPCPVSPPEMVAAFRVHVLWWEISPWPPSWRLLSSQGGDGQQVPPGLGRGSSSKVQASLRAQVPQHGAVPQGPVTAGHTIAASPWQEELSCWGRRGLLAPSPGRWAVPCLRNHSPAALSLSPHCPPGHAQQRYFSIYPRVRPLTRN